MVFKRLLKKIKGESKEEYSNRFLKFYHQNKKRLKKERKSAYHTKKKQGICVRCNKKAESGIVFCAYHKGKQKGYNKKARGK